jgi:hypothetical protein
MELNRNEAEIIKKAISVWETEKRIDPDLANNLRQSVRLRNANLDAVTLYALIAALSCGVLAFIALVIDEKWIELLRMKWGISETLVGLAFSLLAGILVYLARKKKEKIQGTDTDHEVYTLAIILTVGIAITYWTRSFDNFQSQYSMPLLLAAVAYGSVSTLLRSRSLWIVMLLTLAGWWGAQTYHWSGEQFRFAGMNYPLRMTFFGLAIWGGSWVLGKIRLLSNFQDTTYKIGLFLFLLAAWTLSIFGNYDDLSQWKVIKQGYFWYWALGFSLLLVGLIAYAFKNSIDTLRDLAMVFFLVNIYTRYFEYFWDRTNKGIFFALLALSFWIVGRKASRWRSSKLEGTN